MLRVCIILVIACYVPAPSAAIYNDSIFSAENLYPRPWFAVDPPQVAAVATNGLILRQNTILPQEFAKNVILGIANQQRNEARCCHILYDARRLAPCER